MIMITTMAGISARSRPRTSRRLFDAVRGGRDAGSSTSRCFDLVVSVTFDSFTCSDDVGVVPATGELVDDGSVVHDEDAVAGAQIRQLVRHNEDTGAVPPHLVDHVEQSLLGPDVDAGRRVHQHQETRITGYGTRHDDLLLVATGEAPDLLLRARGHHRQVLHEGARDLITLARADPAYPAEALRDGHRGVLGDAQLRDEALVSAVSG